MDQTKYVLSTNIVNFMTHGAWVLMLGRDHISHCNEYALSSTQSILNSTLIAIVLKDYNAVVDFYYSMMGC